MTKKILAWHFVPDSRVLQHSGGNSLTVDVGYVYSEESEDIVICETGLHASRRVYDALGYASGSQLCRVRLWDDVTEHGDKLVARHREVLAIKDIASELRLWGCWCIRNTPLSGNRTVWDLLTDERSRNVVDIAERFATGEATIKQLNAAWDAAWGAARGAARGAAWDAAWGAARGAARDAARGAAWGAAWGAARGAARDAAWDAAWGAARGAARDAAWDAAWGAARGAAWGAAWDAARGVAIKFQADELERRMLKLFKFKESK